MADEELTEFDRKLYRYLVEHDFTVEEWHTPEVARHFGVSEKEVYESLSRLAKVYKDKVWIYYDRGRIRIAAE